MSERTKKEKKEVSAVCHQLSISISFPPPFLVTNITLLFILSFLLISIYFRCTYFLILPSFLYQRSELQIPFSTCLFSLSWKSLHNRDIHLCVLHLHKSPLHVFNTVYLINLQCFSIQVVSNIAIYKLYCNERTLCMCFHIATFRVNS